MDRVRGVDPEGRDRDRDRDRGRGRDQGLLTGAWEVGADEEAMGAT